jgi:hypothetical protein
VSQVLINHPEQWIGVPESFPNDGWATVEDWAAELVEELATEFPAPVEDQLSTLTAAFVEVANSRETRGATRIYASIDTWSGPMYLADLVLAGAGAEGALSLPELVGIDDPDAIRTPTVEDFVTDSGLAGVVVTRYVKPEGFEGIVARVDYAWRNADTLVRLYTAQIDFVDFERVAPRLEALARCVRVG